MKPTYFIPSLFLLMLASFNLQAQDQTQQWYHVEMIVFENSDVITDEQWPEMPVTYKPELVEQGDEVDLLEEEVVATESLNAIASRLTKSPRYQIH